MELALRNLHPMPCAPSIASAIGLSLTLAQLSLRPRTFATVTLKAATSVLMGRAACLSDRRGEPASHHSRAYRTRGAASAAALGLVAVPLAIAHPIGAPAPTVTSLAALAHVALKLLSPAGGGASKLCPEQPARDGPNDDGSPRLFPEAQSRETLDSLAGNETPRSPDLCPPGYALPFQESVLS